MENSTGDLIGPDPAVERPAEPGEDRNGKPFHEVFPQLAEDINQEIERRARPRAEATKTPVYIRLDPDIVDHYKAGGKSWQSRMNDDLRKLAGLR